MKIVICSGTTEASYIIDMFLKQGTKRNELIVINENKEVAKELSETHKVKVYVGSLEKHYTLDDAKINDADLFIALSEKDQDNYVSCLMAKNLYGCKRVIATVKNPQNVTIFKQLGIDSTISSSYLISESIKNASNIEDVFKSLSFEDDLIKIIEIVIKDEYEICNKEIKDIAFPDFATISAINRKPHIIIPKGKTMIKKDDRLIIVVQTKDEEALIDFVTKTKK